MTHADGQIHAIPESALGETKVDFWMGCRHSGDRWCVFNSMEELSYVVDSFQALVDTADYEPSSFETNEQATVNLPEIEK